MSDMEKLEAVVACLDSTIHNAEWSNKTYTACDVEFLKLVLDILKAQEPRAMTLEEVRDEAEYNMSHRWCFKGGATRSGKTYLDYHWIIPMRIRERIDDIVRCHADQVQNVRLHNRFN